VLSRRLRWPAAASAALVMLAGVFVFRSVIDPALWTNELRGTDIRNKYKVTLLLNPISFMYANHYYTPTPQQDREAISNVVGWERFVSEYNPLNIASYWDNVPHRVDHERIAGFTRVYVESALNNPGLFLSNRVAVFCGCLGVNGACLYPFLPHREEIDRRIVFRGFEAEIRRQGLAPANAPPNALARLTKAIRDWSYPEKGFRSPGYFIWNTWPALALLIGLLVTWRSNPRAAAIALIFAAPVSLVFLGVPEAHFKYLTALYFFGFLSIPLAVFDRVLQKRSVIASPTRLS
jgi:hypothetical protein